MSSRSSAFVEAFGTVVVVWLSFSALDWYRVWFHPGCADCLLEIGVPFPFLAHGGLFTETFVIWRGVRDDIVAVALVATACGVLAAKRRASRTAGGSR